MKINVVVSVPNGPLCIPNRGKACAYYYQGFCRLLQRNIPGFINKLKKCNEAIELGREVAK